MKSPLQRFVYGVVALGVLVAGGLYSQNGGASGIAVIPEAVSGWVRVFGNPFGTYARSVSTTAEGVYVVGETCCTLPGQTSAGSSDAYVRKYDLTGNELWTRQFGTFTNDYATGVSSTTEGVYVVGHTFGTLPGQTSLGSNDAYVRKYDLNGTELWTRQFGSSNYEYGWAVSATAEGVYVIGYTEGTLPGQTSAGSSDAYVRKYDLNGNELWTRQFGSSTSDVGYAVSAATDGVYVVGQTDGAFPGQIHSGLSDAFVRKYDLNGNELWTRQFGSSTVDVGYAVSAAAGVVYVVGATDGTLAGQTSAGSYDAYVRKYDLNGNALWTRQFGTSTSDLGNAVSATADGAYVVGYTRDALTGQISAGGFDVFLRNYDTNGNPLGTRQFGTANDDFGYAVSAFPGGVSMAGSLGIIRANAFVTRHTF